MKVKAALTAMFLVLAPLALAGCQSSGAARVQTAKSGDDELEQLRAMQEPEQDSSSAQFDKAVFNKRQEAAFDQIAVLVIAGCLEVGETLSNMGDEKTPPCVTQSLANLLDPSGRVAKNCGARSSRDAFLECAGNGLIVSIMRDFLDQEMQASDWEGGDGLASAMAEQMADRVLKLCYAERKSSIGDCAVEKTGQAFAVPVADISYCQNQGSFSVRMDCVTEAAALALFESAATRRVSL